MSTIPGNLQWLRELQDCHWRSRRAGLQIRGTDPAQPKLKVQFEIIKTLDTRTEHSTGCRSHSAERAEALADDSRGMVPRHERGHPLSLERVCFQGNHRQTSRRQWPVLTRRKPK